MTVKRSDLGQPEPPPPQWSEARYWVAGAVALGIVVLALRAIFPPVPSSLALDTPVPTVVAAPQSVAPTAEVLAPLVIATFTPVPGAPTAAPAPALVVGPTVAASPSCPAPETLPPGVGAGWLARAAGCPHLVLANAGGSQLWVQRPADLPDDLYEQLPEVQP